VKASIRKTKNGAARYRQLAANEWDAEHRGLAGPQLVTGRSRRADDAEPSTP